MRKRTKSRELALQYLYQRELTHSEGAKGQFSLDDILINAHAIPREESIREYARHLVETVSSHSEEVDRLIEKYSDNWRMDRMAVVDRNILRLGTCEIIYCGDIPPKVAINESIELAKKFGDAESSKFVNGILDKIAKKNETPEEN